MSGGDIFFTMKPKTTIKEQIEILKSRGCVIDDDNFAADILLRINYYRFTAYFLPYRYDNNNYLDNTKFTTIHKIYEFDKELRAIIFTIIEEIEVNFRARISYYFAHKYEADGYLNPNNYNKKHNHEKFKDNINDCLRKHKNNLIVKHHQKKYGGEYPIWVLIELFTFGMLSYFYSDLKTEDKQILATQMFGTTHNNVSSWLRCCTDLRNICAHYERLYFHTFSAIPAGLSEIDENSQRTLFGAISMLKALYCDNYKWDNEILPNIKNLFEKYAGYIDTKHIGFPENWEGRLKK